MNFDKLLETNNQLKDIRDYLVKCNKERRRDNPKLDDAKTLYQPIPDFINRTKLRYQKGEISLKDAQTLSKIIDSIKARYKEIEKLVKDESPDEGLNVCESLIESESQILQNSNMSTFDLKLAVGLLPMLDDTEAKTSQLIDAVDLYSSMLATDDDKKNLVKFVLKTRLTHGTKIRLKSTYSTVGDLLNDMRIHLLTRKSDTALQNKLSRCKQGNRSLEDFAKEIEELFVDLTISQADGDDAAFKILKPLNEKNAIKKFADGLRSQHLSTVIAARKFDNLKDAIRSAQDEEVGNSDNQQIFTMRNCRSRGYNNLYRGYNNNFQPQRGFYRGRSYTPGRFQRGNHPQPRNTDQGRSRRYFRGNQNNYRGNQANFSRNQHSNRNDGRPNRNNINYVEESEKQEQEESQTLNQFFRD